MANPLLASLGPDIAHPAYDRSRVRAGIAHFGVGNFHRTHQAFYLDRCLADPAQHEWGILGIGALDVPAEREKAAALRAQEGLYTLTVCPPDAPNSVRLIGALVEYLHVPDDPEAVLKRLADPGIRIVSLTITEGGYNFDPSGRFRLDNPDVAHDLHHQPPRGLFGLVTEALRRRRQAGVGPFTILSCDNLMHNGKVAKAAFLAFARARDPELAQWIQAHVSFPSSMVDGIAPAVTPADVARLNAASGANDRVPVFREDFTQWVMEDDFCAGRPNLAAAGVQFTSSVTPYELVKLRMLNAGHSMIAIPSMLLGHRLVHEAMADEMIATLLEEFLLRDAGPHLTAPPDMPVDAYAALILRRFRNPAIGDQIARIAGQSSVKLPIFLQETARAVLHGTHTSVRIAFLLAAFAEYLRGQDDEGRNFPVIEPALSDADLDLARSHDPRAFLGMSIFTGWGLEAYPDFETEVAGIRRAIASEGIRETLRAVLLE
jgi:mannitol 2-dehydrogenase